MQKNNKLNIPAVLMHEVNGVQYRVNGIITAINESNNTCSMKFRGYPVFNGIPMNSIYMNYFYFWIIECGDYRAPVHPHFMNLLCKIWINFPLIFQ